MGIRHTVIFTFYKTTSRDEIDEVIKRLNEMGEYLQTEIGVTNWNVAEHIPGSYKEGRANLLQDGVFPNIESLNAHTSSDVHKHVIELTPKVCDWMTVDTIVP